MEMQGHWIRLAKDSGAERMCLRRRSKSPANGVLLDIPNTVLEFLLVHDLALVETACPHIQLALQAKGEASLDELHGLLERNIRSGCNERSGFAEGVHRGWCPETGCGLGPPQR